MNKIEDILNGLHNFIMEMQSIENIKNYHRATDEIIADVLSEIRRIRLEELPKERGLDYFLLGITHADIDLANIQARSMELGYSQAIIEARKNIEEED